MNSASQQVMNDDERIAQFTKNYEVEPLPFADTSTWRVDRVPSRHWGASCQRHLHQME
jgi:hypothetical protein